jgi:hypothetical protein
MERIKMDQRERFRLGRRNIDFVLKYAVPFFKPWGPGAAEKVVA